MEVLNVIVAAAACWMFGALWYGMLSEPWMEAAGVAKGADGRPEGMNGPTLYVKSFCLILIVAGMMRHVFEMSGISTIGLGILAGLGVGLFFIVPWMALNHMYGGRPAKLTAIDGGYAAIGCTIIGLVLALF